MGLIAAGCDPGVCPAIGIVERQGTSLRVLLAHKIVTDPKARDEDRFNHIVDEIQRILGEFKPSVMGVEQQSGAQVRQAQEGRTTYSSSKVSRVETLIAAVCRIYRVPWIYIPPQTAKVAILGKGGGRSPSRAEGKRRIKLALAPLLIGFGSTNVDERDGIAIAVAAGRRHFATWALDSGVVVRSPR